MCGKSAKAPAPVVKRDPVEEQRQAEARAQVEANEALAAKRRKRAFSGAVLSSMQRGGSASANGPSLMAQATPEP